MGLKEEAIDALERLMADKCLAKSTVGRLIAGDPNFVDRLRDPLSDIQTKTLDSVWRFILEQRGQKTFNLELDFEKDK